MSGTTILFAASPSPPPACCRGCSGWAAGFSSSPLSSPSGAGQVEAGATSLLAIVPTAAVGIWRQTRYGNMRVRPAVVVGVASIAGVEVGVRIATAMPEHALRRLFGLLLLLVAAQLVWQTVRIRRRYPGAT